MRIKEKIACAHFGEETATPLRVFLIVVEAMSLLQIPLNDAQILAVQTGPPDARMSRRELVRLRQENRHAQP